jgi:EVE domain-containing protein
MNYWIGVVSKEHVMRGVKLGIVQIGHGKRSGLARMKPGDGFIYYSSKQKMDDKVPRQAFTAIGFISEGDIYQADEGEFKPWRRNIDYLEAQDTPIRPLLNELSFTQGKINWGYAFRYGLLKITKEDFDLIAKFMNATAS